MDICAGLSGLAAPISLKTEFGLADDLNGIIIGTSSFAYITAALLAGILSDRWGATLTIRIGTAIIALDCLVYSFAQSKWLFILCTLAAPLGHAFFWPSFQAWFGRGVDRRETARRVGIFSVSWSLGLNAVGPKLGGELMERSPRLPFATACVISIAVFLFFQWLKPELERHETHAGGIADEDHPPSIRRKFLVTARIANLMAVYAIVTLRTFIPLVCVDWKITASAIGTLIMVLGVSHSGSFLVLSLTEKWHFRFRYLVGGQVLGMAGLLILGVGGSRFLDTTAEGAATLGISLAIPALILVGLMAGICFMSSSFYSLYGQEEKGKNSGINESIIGMSNGLALYLGGGAVHWLGSMGPYWTCGLVVGLCLVFQVWLYKKEKVAPSLRN
jgi:predicted MFS family arabinose efflux permease